MEICCDLVVDVNGEEIFMVDKRILARFSGRFSKLFSRLNSSTKNLKVIFHNFPGGAKGFELMARFCYSSGKIERTASNTVLLSRAARFMEMRADGSGNPILMDQMEKPLEEIYYWTWSELLVALKQFQDLLSTTDSSFILEKVMDCLVERITLSVVASSYESSSDNSTFKFSYDTRSTDSTMNICSQRSWWFEDLLFLNIDLIEKVIKMMIPRNLDHYTICKFLFYYRKSRFPGASPADKCKITEVVINLLCLLDRSSPSFKNLFDIFRVVSSLKISKHCRKKLEHLIGSQLDQATVDYLLVPSPQGKDYIYDVSLVLRLVKVFLFESCSWLSMSRLNNVSELMDSYLAEVSPDSHLKPSKFSALLKVLPDSTRHSHDGLYHAMDTYLEVHSTLCEEEKMRVCSALNYEKLSCDALKHLVLNSKFPSKVAVKSFIKHQFKLKSLLQNTHQIVAFSNSLDGKEYIVETTGAEKILHYVKKNNLSTETGKFEDQYHGMQWRVMELEKIFRIKQTDMGHITKRRSPSLGSARYLPKLCS